MLAGLLQLENSNFEGVLCRKFNALSRDAYGLAPTEELEGVTRRKFAAIGMFASIFSVQLGLRYNWRISRLKVLHGSSSFWSDAWHGLAACPFDLSSRKSNLLIVRQWSLLRSSNCRTSHFETPRVWLGLVFQQPVLPIQISDFPIFSNMFQYVPYHQTGTSG